MRVQCIMSVWLVSVLCSAVYRSIGQWVFDVGISLNVPARCTELGWFLLRTVSLSVQGPTIRIQQREKKSTIYGVMHGNCFVYFFLFQGKGGLDFLKIRNAPK